MDSQIFYKAPAVHMFDPRKNEAAKSMLSIHSEPKANKTSGNRSRSSSIDTDVEFPSIEVLKSRLKEVKALTRAEPSHSIGDGNLDQSKDGGSNPTSKNLGPAIYIDSDDSEDTASESDENESVQEAPRMISNRDHNASKSSDDFGPRLVSHNNVYDTTRPDNGEIINTRSSPTRNDQNSPTGASRTSTPDTEISDTRNANAIPPLSEPSLADGYQSELVPHYSRKGDPNYENLPTIATSSTQLTARFPITDPTRLWDFRKVTDRRIFKGKPMCYVYWKPTWELESELKGLKGAKELLDEFEGRPQDLQTTDEIGGKQGHKQSSKSQNLWKIREIIAGSGRGKYFVDWEPAWVFESNLDWEDEYGDGLFIDGADRKRKRPQKMKKTRGVASSNMARQFKRQRKL